MSRGTAPPSPAADSHFSVSSFILFFLDLPPFFFFSSPSLIFGIYELKNREINNNYE
jgi:hypothetical protein